MAPNWKALISAKNARLAERDQRIRDLKDVIKKLTALKGAPTDDAISPIGFLPRDEELYEDEDKKK